MKLQEGSGEEGREILTLVHILYSSKRLCGKVWGGRGVVRGVCALVTVKHLSPWVFQLQLTNHNSYVFFGGEMKSLYRCSPLHIWA